MNQERCKYCGRMTRPIKIAGGKVIQNYTCDVCFGGKHRIYVAHSKAVLLAWKYRAMYREIRQNKVTSERWHSGVIDILKRDNK